MLQNLFLSISAAFYELTPEARLIAIIFILILIVGVFFLLGRKIGQLENASQSIDNLKNARQDAVKRSRSVLEGQIVEQLAPLLPGFPCNISDARFLGKPVDFVAFCGMTERDEVAEILFVEVKTGGAQLSEREKQIKRAVEQGRVRYVEWRAK